MMKTVTLKIPDYLAIKIRRAMAARKECFSDLARRALAREVEETEIDFAKLAAPYREMFNGARNLSSCEGYGTKAHLRLRRACSSPRRSRRGLR